MASARTAARTARAPRPGMTAEEQEENDLFTAQLMSMMGTFEQLAKNPRMQKLLKTKDYRMGSQAETSQQATSRQRQVTEPVERVPTVVTGLVQHVTQAQDPARNGHRSNEQSTHPTIPVHTSFPGYFGGNSIHETTGCSDPMDSLSIYAYIAKSEANEATVKEKRKQDEETTGSSKRATRSSYKKEEGPPPKPTPEVVMEDAPKDKKQGEPRGPSYKLKYDIELATDLKKVFEERILNNKVEMTSWELSSIRAPDMLPGDPYGACANVKPVNLESEEVGHDFDAPNEDGQPPELAENDFQQHDEAENELSHDVDPLPENVDHWVRRSTRVRRLPHRFDSSLHHIMLSDEGEPLTYKEANSCELSSKWELAMQEEIKSLYANNTWDLVPLPKGRKALPNKWVYKIKIVDEKPNYSDRLET
ncbi:hypothetical protein L7F22_014260 [Adiantum nelumboides]|nr:hypothetical protein [Adiantum nelumboides]